jgi:hypothetical protein
MLRLLLTAIGCAAACLSSGARADWMATNDPLAAPVRPADGATVEQTPPDFSWPDAAQDAKYTLHLTYPDGRTRTLPAPQNYANWNEVLPPGRYTWLVVKGEGKEGKSDARSFTVGRDAKPFVAPDMKELLAKVKAKPHPRGLPDAATLKKMAEQRPQGITKLTREVELRSRSPVLPEPNTGSPNADNTRVYEETKRTMNALAAYALVKEERYFAEALRRVKNMASWDPNGTTAYTRHGVNMGARTMTYALVLGYDWLHPKLDSQTQKSLLEVIRVRLAHIEKDVIGARSRVAAHPRDSHAQLSATMLGMMATLMAGDLPEADAWAQKTLPLALNLIQPWGGEDGGFSNGTAYALWDTGDLQPHWYVLRWATGIDVAQKAWVRNHTRFLAYFNPPGTPARLFGDGHEQAQLFEQTARFGKGVSWFAPTPLARWYASRLSGEDAMRFEYIMAPPDAGGAAPFPAGTPNSLYLPTTGWVAMHSSLEDEKRVSVYFKSSPPPHGAFAHQHADQNSFVVNAGGKRLAIESGYYDGYKTRHWWNWLKQTRAKNAITYDGGKGQIFFEATDYKKMGYGRITRFESGEGQDLATGDATAAYDGALSLARRSIAYLRPSLIVVHDKLASQTPRRWEWNIHALQKINSLSERKIKIENEGQTLCVEMISGPEMQFSQTDEWQAAGPTRGDNRVYEGAEPIKGEKQWHGRFSTAPLREAEFLAVLDVGCSGNGRDAALKLAKDLR